MLHRGEENGRHFLGIFNDNASKADVDWWRAGAEKRIQVRGWIVYWGFAEEKPADVCACVSAFALFGDLEETDRYEKANRMAWELERVTSSR